MNVFLQYCRVVFVAFAVLGLTVQGALAQGWPTRSVRIIVPFEPGGGTDIQGRLLSKKFTESLGQTFIIENRAGASGLIGAELVARAPADGLTFLMTTASLSVATTLYKSRMKFDPVKDLQSVSWLSSVPLVLTVKLGLPVRDVKEFIAFAKKPGNTLNAASNGPGTTSHLAIEFLNQVTGANVTHVPYKGGGPASASVLSGETDFVFQTAVAIQPHVRSGKVRPLAVTTAKQSSAFPALPTMNSIFPGFVLDNWYSIFAPAGTPQEIVTRLHAEILKAIKSDEIRNFMASEGADPVASTPEQLTSMFDDEIKKYAKLIKERNVTVDK